MYRMSNTHVAAEALLAALAVLKKHYPNINTPETIDQFINFVALYIAQTVRDSPTVEKDVEHFGSILVKNIVMLRKQTR